MIKTSIEKISRDIGFDIGSSDDVTQANLLNGFCEAISNSMDQHRRSLQLCYVADKLSPKSCEILKELAEFIKLKDGN